MDDALSRKLITVTDVFTPNSIARLTFVERKNLQSKLVRALRTPGKQIVIYGHSGSGKSTLLFNKLFQLYEDQITTRCMNGMTFDQLVLAAFDDLDAYYKDSGKRSTGRTVAKSVAADYLGIKAKIDSTSHRSTESSYKRILPPQLTPQRLAEFMGEAKCCWVLEDFHKVDSKEKKKLSQVMKVFMDMAVHYPELKVIAIGAVDKAREVVECDSEMRNRVAEIEVPLMESKESREILKKGGKVLNVQFSKEISDGIIGFSNGLAAITHQLCLNLCFAAEITESLNSPYPFDRKEFEEAIHDYISDESDTIKSEFDEALARKGRSKFDNCQIIVSALAAFETMDGVTREELFEQIRKEVPDYLKRNLGHYLAELSSSARCELLRINSKTGKIYFNNPFHKAFAQAYFYKQRMKQKSRRTKDVSRDEIIREMTRLISLMSKKQNNLGSYFIFDAFK